MAGPWSRARAALRAAREAVEEAVREAPKRAARAAVETVRSIVGLERKAEAQARRETTAPPSESKPPTRRADYGDSETDRSDRRRDDRHRLDGRDADADRRPVRATDRGAVDGRRGSDDGGAAVHVRSEHSDRAREALARGEDSGARAATAALRAQGAAEEGDAVSASFAAQEAQEAAREAARAAEEAGEAARAAEEAGEAGAQEAAREAARAAEEAFTAQEEAEGAQEAAEEAAAAAGAFEEAPEAPEAPAAAPEAPEAPAAAPEAPAAAQPEAGRVLARDEAAPPPPQPTRDEGWGGIEERYSLHKGPQGDGSLESCVDQIAGHAAKMEHLNLDVYLTLHGPDGESERVKVPADVARNGFDSIFDWLAGQGYEDVDDYDAEFEIPSYYYED